MLKLNPERPENLTNSSYRVYFFSNSYSNFLIFCTVLGLEYECELATLNNPKSRSHAERKKLYNAYAERTRAARSRELADKFGLRSQLCSNVILGVDYESAIGFALNFFKISKNQFLFINLKN